MKAQNNLSNDVKAFRIAIPDSGIKDPEQRIAQARWPDSINGVGWSYEADMDYIQGIASYWRESFDWTSQENQLNAASQYMVDVDGFTIHFVYQIGKSRNSTAVVLLRGWPGSFVQMMEVIPLLTADGEDHHSFDVIVPSLPGYAFSGRPTE